MPMLTGLFPNNQNYSLPEKKITDYSIQMNFSNSISGKSNFVQLYELRIYEKWFSDQVLRSKDDQRV